MGNLNAVSWTLRANLSVGQVFWFEIVGQINRSSIFEYSRKNEHKPKKPHQQKKIDKSTDKWFYIYRRGNNDLFWNLDFDF